MSYSSAQRQSARAKGLAFLATVNRGVEPANRPVVGIRAFNGVHRRWEPCPRRKASRKDTLHNPGTSLPTSLSGRRSLTAATTLILLAEELRLDSNCSVPPETRRLGEGVPALPAG